MAPAPAASTSESKSELAYQLLHDRIVSGEYEPGRRLVLGHVGKELDCSVVPVREAVRRLEAEGLVTFARNVGARVAEIDEHEYLETMQVLSIVEGAAVMLAAPYISPALLASARGINDRMRALLEDFDAVEFTALNERFHRTLSDPCPNSHLGEIVDRGWTRLNRLRRSTFGFVPERARKSVEEHAQILRLIGDGAESSLLETAVREHRLATPRAFALRADHAFPHQDPFTTPSFEPHVETQGAS